MRVAALVFMMLSMPVLTVAQEWEEFVSRQDGFSINFPGKPTVTEITWQSQLRSTIGPGYWKQDERGATVFALAKYLNGPYKVTDYAWDWQDMVERHSLQMNGPDGRRTLVYVSMHDRKLYILESSAPEDHPEPGLFQQSMGYLDKDGNRIRYTETVYSNSYHGLGVYPRPAYRVSGQGQ